jgi:hypothetical protein
MGQLWRFRVQFGPFGSPLVQSPPASAELQGLKRKLERHVAAARCSNKFGYLPLRDFMVNKSPNISHVTRVGS